MCSMLWRNAQSAEGIQEQWQWDTEVVVRRASYVGDTDNQAGENGEQKKNGEKLQYALHFWAMVSRVFPSMSLPSEAWYLY